MNKSFPIAFALFLAIFSSGYSQIMVNNGACVLANNGSVFFVNGSVEGYGGEWVFLNSSFFQVNGDVESFAGIWNFNESSTGLISQRFILHRQSQLNRNGQGLFAVNRQFVNKGAWVNTGVIEIGLRNGSVFGQNDYLNDTTGVFVNKSILRFLADSGNFANAQTDIASLNNSNGIIEFVGKNNRFTDRNLTALPVSKPSTALGSRFDFRPSGIVRYSGIADTQFVQPRYYSLLEMDNVATKRIPDSVLVGAQYTVKSNTGNRLYAGTFFYDGEADQTIYPERGVTPLLNRYYNLKLQVSSGTADPSEKSIDTATIVRIDGVLKSRVEAPLTVRGQLYLGNFGQDSSETFGVVVLKENSLLRMGERPAVFENNVTSQKGRLQALQFAGYMTVKENATMELTDSQSLLEMASGTTLNVDGDFRNRGNGVNLSVNDNSTVVYLGRSGQEIEFATRQNPYGNLYAYRAKTTRGSVNIAGNLTVNAGNISVLDTLTMLSSQRNVAYVGGMEEVVGKMRHVDIQNSSVPLQFSNRATRIEIVGAAAERPKELIVENRPLSLPANYIDTTDVFRKLILTYAGGGNSWEAHIRAGYRLDEIVQLGNSENLLEFYESDLNAVKKLNTKIVNPANDYQRFAASSAALGYVELKGVRSSGSLGVPPSAQFASGKELLIRRPVDTASNPSIYLSARVLMEGSYRSELLGMDNDLRKSNLIPSTPPDMYPYNLDPKRSNQTVAIVPDSIVDWATVELRSELSGGITHYRNCFVRKDGILVDFDGVSPVLLPITRPAEYYVVVRHRNHLAVMTQSQVMLDGAQSAGLLDFSKSATALGGENALKPLFFQSSLGYVYGMIAGDYNGDGVIDEQDYNAIWQQRDNEGYWNAESDMQGIITTRDFNVSWNNRTRQTAVPK